MSYSEAITKNDLKKILGNIGFGSLNDYIIEQGTSGIWTYRKWKSGVAECWGIYSGNITSRTANAPYNSSVFDIGTVDYPTGFFADIPNVNVNTRIGSFYNLTSYANSYKDNVSISITSNASGTQTVYAYIYAKGKWKNDIETYQGIGSIGAVLLDTFHPVGSYYETSDANFNPNTEWGGTWVKLAHNTLLTSLTYKPNGNTTAIGNITIPVDGYYMFIVGWSNGKPLFAGLSTDTQSSPTQVIYDGTDSGGEYNVVMYMTAGIQKVWVRAQSSTGNNAFYVYKVNYVDDNVNRWHRTA